MAILPNPRKPDHRLQTCPDIRWGRPICQPWSTPFIRYHPLVAGSGEWKLPR